MKMWLIAMMVVLILVAVDITVRHHLSGIFSPEKPTDKMLL